ncbi:MAG: AAA family ATPase [Prosthecobacter sp.]|jgi:predicted ATPase|uniref:AAA family ATPase n=1 Tax=Prosthecobacter sp. TaxID=1965333 RepID=UPI0019EFAED1|nr:AAA family ATPase [Prosthecobacter sp.]MBE2284803.1 AAA family ATPase [Prosthecobacter sp.]
MPDNSNPILIRHLAPKNFLSFGPENVGIDLQSLNLFIGPNGSGKSNLIEAISLMRAAPKEWRDVTRRGGGVAEWIWKGNPKQPASVEWVVTKLPWGEMHLRHAMAFEVDMQSFDLEDERIENEHSKQGEAKPYFFYRYQNGDPVINRKDATGPRGLARETIEPDRSILAQRRDPESYPELAWLAINYEKVRIYREWAFGRSAVFREPQKADMRNDILEEDFSNLGLFLNRLKTRFPVAKRAILAGLKDLYDGITDFDVFIEGGTVQVFFTEGDFVIPATRLSDGTLRYLCLLAILCDPEPPPLICIEEPELGLHPDILPGLADLLKAASERTQIIVTTHSDILVDAMTETPECVVVCEKHEGRTEMKRLSAPDLADWLKDYRLGQLWTKGHLGGTRW